MLDRMHKIFFRMNKINPVYLENILLFLSITWPTKHTPAQYPGALSFINADFSIH